MKKRKNNTITSIALIFAIILMALLPLPVAHAANFSVSKSNISIETGKTSTITINAPTHTGRLDINSSNSGIAITNEKNLWVENNSKTITISAKSAGTATITISGELYDSSTEKEEKFSKTVKVTVTKPVVLESTNTSGNNNSTGTTENTTNTNQKPNVSTNLSESQNNTSKPNSTTTNKPSVTTSSKPATSTKPTTQFSSSAATSKPSNTSTTTSTDTSNTQIPEPITEIEENIEEIGNEVENVKEEKKEEISQEEATIEQEQMTAEINNMEETRKIQINSRLIIIAIIGIIAVVMIFIGIGVSKNIFKK